MAEKQVATVKDRFAFQKTYGKIGIYIALIIGAFFAIYPLFFMIMNSFKTGPEILHEPLSFPKAFNLETYITIFQKFNMGIYFFNSIFISGSVTLLNVLFSSMVAFGISKTKIPGRKFIFNMIIGSMMIPGVLLLVPTYFMMFNWGWINTYRVLIIPAAISASNIFLMNQFISQIDDAYLEAARVDGANEWQIFFKIVLPMATPGLATIAIMTFMGTWNDLFGPLLYMRDDNHFTLQRAVFELNYGLPGEFRNQLYAALTLVTLPIVVLFFFLQRFIIKAYSGGVKF